MNNRRKLGNIWRHMVRRCHNSDDQSYKYYRKRGISVVEEWHDFNTFYMWAVERYKTGYTIDRIDNDKGYGPENCRWVTKAVNNCNRGMQENNSSGYIGVCWRKEGQNWEAKIRYQLKAIHLGRFSTAEEAVKVRNNYISDNKLPFPIQRVGSI